ncbi:MAG: bifunctional lytic transglycosylase/C40 family peptidase [Dehalococcoidia bacterium]|nr:bifunctional lytic transglycosylase/C40 family peptidase [Dehalococcoidia bacterium]
MDADELEVPDVLGSLGRDAMKLVGVLAVLLFAPLILLLAAFGGLPEAARTTAASAAIAEIPPDQLEVMQQVSLQTGIPWQILAAIAKVESDFGGNMAVSSAGAIGYCQFMPETWDAYGGNGDGVADPYDFRDCIPAMGRYLVANGAPADLRRALYAYNHSWAYVEKVLAYAAAYGYVDPSSIPARAVELARSRVGAPYVWGATGPDAFDCSGLVLWVYRQLGLQVPRTARQQFERAVPIEPSQLQPGDLVFYENTYPSPDRITHVGIYVGGGIAVMATNTGDYVREVPLSDPYWSAHFVGAGRPPYWEVPA